VGDSAAEAGNAEQTHPRPIARRATQRPWRFRCKSAIDRRDKARERASWSGQQPPANGLALGYEQAENNADTARGRDRADMAVSPFGCRSGQVLERQNVRALRRHNGKRRFKKMAHTTASSASAHGGTRLTDAQTTKGAQGWQHKVAQSASGEVYRVPGQTQSACCGQASCQARNLAPPAEKREHGQGRGQHKSARMHSRVRTEQSKNRQLT
jgi:hypothetical protein